MVKWWRGLRTVVQYPSPQQSLHCQSSLYHTIQAIPRECTGSRVSTRDRLQGRIPAVVFSQSLLDKNPSSRSLSRKQLLTTEKKQIQAILKSVKLPFFCSTTFLLQIRAGSGSSKLLESGTVLPIKASLFFLFNNNNNNNYWYLHFHFIYFIFWVVLYRYIGMRRLGRYWIWCLFGPMRERNWKLTCLLFLREKRIVPVSRKVCLHFFPFFYFHFC